MRLPLPAMLLTVLSLGVLLPWIRGRDYLNPQLLFIISLISLAFTGRLTLTLADSRTPLTAGLLAGLYSHILAILVVTNGLLTVNILNRFGWPTLPPSYFLISLWGFSIAINAFSGLGTAWLLAKGTPPSRALIASRAFFFVSLVCVILLNRVLNPVFTTIAFAQLGVIVASILLISNMIFVRLLSSKG